MNKKRSNGKEQVPKTAKNGRTINTRMVWILVICGILLFLPLFWQLYQVMIQEHDHYERLATENQTRSTKVSASRGTIYDRNMNIMAISASVENVFLDPNEIATKEQDINFIASGLSEILDVDKSWIIEQAADTTMRYKVIKRKICLLYTSRCV